jgi:hypothetical protein
MRDRVNVSGVSSLHYEKRRASRCDVDSTAGGGGGRQETLAKVELRPCIRAITTPRAEPRRNLCW